MIRVAWFAVLIAASLNVAAHRQHFAWTEVAYDPQGEAIQFVHRFHEHDAAEWLRQQSPDPVNMTELRAQARFARYVQENFFVTLNGEALPIELIGAELEGAWLFVYGEAKSAVSKETVISGLRFSGRLLMDLFADQVHHIEMDMTGAACDLAACARATARLDISSQNVVLVAPATQ